MGIEVERQKEKQKIILIAVLLAGSCFLTYYFHQVLQTGTVFTHFFYIPITLASLWWRRKGVAVAIFLAVFLVFSHHILREYVLTANDYFRALIFVAIGVAVALLSERIFEAQEKVAHLNAILHAIRNVNQLISKGKDRDRLLKDACENLIETRGYYNAWIALLDENRDLVTTAESGLGKDFLPMADRLKGGKLTDCGQKSLRQSEVVVTKDPLSSCTDCPLSQQYSGRGAMTIQLEHGGKLYGLFSVSIPIDFLFDEEEKSLFQGVAMDISSALNSIQLEEERKRAEETLQERIKELDCLYRISNLVEKPGISLGEILQGTVDLIPSSWQYPEITCTRVIAEGQEFITNNFQETIWKQTRDITMHGERIGSVEVCYLEEKPESDAGPFLKEERSLINAIAERLGRIIEHTRAEEALQESEDRYSALFDRSLDCVFVNTPDGDFIDANSAALNLLGYKREDIRSLNYALLLSEEQLPMAFKALEEIVETGSQKEMLELKLRRRDGKSVYVETKGSLIYRDGKPYAVQGIARDITERKQAERDRERLLAELEAKNKELESFVYSITHDLKTPLVSLQGFSSLLQREFHDQLDEEGKHYMERIQGNVAHMDSLISDLLELSRIGRVVGPIEEINVGTVLKEIQQNLSIELKEAGTELVVQEPLPAVHADPGRIRQVFTNLIDNALKFRSQDRPLRIEVGCKEERGSYRIHVADNGIGIAPQYQEQIFNPFRKLDPKTEGMGIGLALVKKIVEHHGGRVWIESPSTLLRTPTEAAEGQEGGGATFYLTLPRREES